MLKPLSGNCRDREATGRPVRATGAIVLALLVAACGGSSVPGAEDPFGQFLRGTTDEPRGITRAELAPPTPCPRIMLRSDTGTLRVTRGGDEFEEGTLRYQARIEKTARECTPDATGTRVRVGVAGRALSGPDEVPGTVRLPVRIVVREGGEVTYSKLHQVSVNLTAGAPSATFAMVDEEVRVSNVNAARILVGFDEGG